MMRSSSRDSDQPAPHHPPLLSSLVVRPSNSDGSGGGGGVTGGREYTLANGRNDSPLHVSRPGRYSDDDLGYRTRTRSPSPAGRRNSERHYSPDLDHPPRGRDFRSHGGTGRIRDPSPPYETGRAAGRSYNRGFGGARMRPSSFRGEAEKGNKQNVRPREGDWYCADPACNNLNFARRDYCHNCHRPRPHRAAPGPVVPSPIYPSPRRFSGPHIDRSPPRPLFNGYRSPPRDWARDGPHPRGFLPPPAPLPRPDYSPRRDRLSFLEDELKGRREKFDHLREGGLFSGRKGGYGRLSPPPLRPLPPPAGDDRWGRGIRRERSQSPIGGGGLRRGLFMDRGRDDRGSGGRDRIGRNHR